MNLARRTASTTVMAALVVSALGACSPNEPTDPSGSGAITTGSSPQVDVASRDDLMNSLTANVIGPAYVRVDDRASDLVAAVTTLCVAPTDGTALDAARVAWRATRGAWAFTRSTRFGPVMEQRAMSKVDFPVDPDKVTALIAGGNPLDIDSIAALGSDQRGLGALELVLFADDTISARECEFAASAGELIHRTTSAVADAWVDAPPTDSKTFIDELVNGLIFALVEVGDQKLGKASGDVTGQPEFTEIDDGPARSALDDIASVLDGVSAVIDGGLAELITTISPDASARLRAELDDAIAAAAAVPRPMATTVDTAPLAAAYAAVLGPLRTLRTEVASLLGVTLTLGDADGDS